MNKPLAQNTDPPPSGTGVQRLRFFTPFSALSDDELIILADKVRVEKAAEGTRLLEQGATEADQYFLLDGVVELEARDGMRRVIEGGTDNARAPLAPARPSEHHVVALSPLRLIRLSGVDLSCLGPPAAAAEHGAAPEVDHAVRDHPVYLAIRKALQERRLQLPSLPEVAVRIRRALEDGTAGLKEIARIVGSDPAVAAKLIKAANSALYRGSKPIDSCPAAIVRLGLKTTRHLVMSFTLRELFKVEDAALKNRIQAVWRHSTEVAAICFVLARLTPGFDPEEAMLAGLLHDIGVMPILTYAQQEAELKSDPAHLDALVAALRAEVGGMILRGWGFSDNLVAAAVQAEDWRHDSGARADYCDLVIIAQLHSFIGTPEAAHHPRMDELPAFAKLAPGKLTPQLSLKILDVAKAQITETQKLLAG